MAMWGRGALRMLPALPLSLDHVSSRQLLLPRDPTRRYGLFIAPSRVRIETGPAAGAPIGQPGLFTSVRLEPGAFVAFYTGDWHNTLDFDRLPPARRLELGRYAIEVPQHGVIVAPPFGREGVDFVMHAAAAMNEPNSKPGLNDSNVFVQSTVVDVAAADGGLRSFVCVVGFTCKAVEAGGELLWNYGDDYADIRSRMKYEAGPPCAETLIKALALEPVRPRAEALLASAGRRDDALHELHVTSAADSDEEWTPVVRRKRRGR